MKFIKSKKALLLLATLVVAAVAAIGAYAWFSSTGSDSTQTASVGTAANFSVSNTEQASQPALFPVATAGDAPYDNYDWSVKNVDSGVEHYASIDAKIDPTFIVHGTGGAPDCTPADFLLSANGTTWSASTVQLKSAGTLTANDHAAGGTDEVSGTFSVQLKDNGANQNACQGATPTIVVAAS